VLSYHPEVVHVPHRFEEKSVAINRGQLADSCLVIDALGPDARWVKKKKKKLISPQKVIGLWIAKAAATICCNP
jgi:hypothetical protein